MTDSASKIKSIISSDFNTVFLFNDDYNSDCLRETILGFSLPDDYENNIYVLITNSFKSSILSLTEEYNRITGASKPPEFHSAFVKYIEDEKYIELYVLLKGEDSSLIPVKIRWNNITPVIYT